MGYYRIEKELYLMRNKSLTDNYCFIDFFTKEIYFSYMIIRYKYMPKVGVFNGFLFNVLFINRLRLFWEGNILLRMWGLLR